MQYPLLIALAFSAALPAFAGATPTRFGESRDTMPRNPAVQLELVRESLSDADYLREQSPVPVAVSPEEPNGSASGDPRVRSDLSSLYYEKDLAGAPILQFEERQVSFDTVVRGERREHTYRFKNVSEVPATIAIASACTCTTLEWTRGEIGPGESGEVHAVFDSSEKRAGELIVIDVILEESAASGNGIIEQVAYDFEIVEPAGSPE